ncbi:MAG: histidine kinase dimerization/phospho-acceptor domain-containing protein, partial [bacterium]
MKRSIHLLVFLTNMLPTVLPTVQVASQELQAMQNRGRPPLYFVKNFSFKEYGAAPQNWGITQDKNGLMYFANNEGLLEFDGSSWRLLKPLKNATIFSVAIDSAGYLYVGGYDEFGYFPPGYRDEAHFVALHDSLPPQHPIINRVHQILPSSQGVYFLAGFRQMFRWADGRLKIWESKAGFRRCFLINNEFYTSQRDKGLMRMTSDSLTVIPGSEIFSGSKIRVMLPYHNHTILIGAPQKGLFLYSDGIFTPFPTEADYFLKDFRGFNGVRLPNGHFVFGRDATGITAKGGAVVIDKQGILLNAFNQETGLLSDDIWFLNVDHQGGLWLALQNGLARIETLGPFSVYARREGLIGRVQAIHRHQGILYVGTTAGLFYLSETGNGKAARLEPVVNTPPICRDLISIGQDLLAVSWNINLIRNNKASRAFLSSPRINVLQASKLDPNTVYLGGQSQLYTAKKVRGQWANATGLGRMTVEIVTMAQEKNGTLWLGTQGQGLIRYQGQGLISADTSEIQITRFQTAHGLPVGAVHAFSFNDRVLFGTTKGLHRFEAAWNKFVPDSTFGPMLTDSTFRINQFKQDNAGRVWIIGGAKHAGIHMGIPQIDGSYIWVKTPFQRLQDVYFNDVVYPDVDGAVWFGSGESIIRYDPNVSKNAPPDYSALIRKITVIPGDSAIFRGTTNAGKHSMPIPFSNNSLRFQYAAPSYDDISANQYQVILKGYDDDWLGWTTDTKKEYTNLSAGNYRFIVRAKNVYGHISSEAVYAFEILAPWYQTGWAYLLYVLFASGIIALIVQARVRHLERKTKKLEAVIADRTAEIVNQKNKIEDQAVKLQEADTLKSRFFANISHEFRTPLTLILGPLEERIAKAKKKTDKEEFGMMHRNAGRLLQLINQLLDLSRLESGKMKLNAGRGDFVAFLKGIVMSFASLAEQKGITLQFEPYEGSIP